MLNRFIRWIQRYKGWFGGGAVICIFLGLYTGLFASPPDYYQGELVRIMYVHVPLAHTSTLAYSVLFFGSIWYLWKRDPLVDNACQASAGICALFYSPGPHHGFYLGKAYLEHVVDMGSSSCLL